MAHLHELGYGTPQGSCMELFSNSVWPYGVPVWLTVFEDCYFLQETTLLEWGSRLDRELCPQQGREKRRSLAADEAARLLSCCPRS